MTEFENLIEKVGVFKQKLVRMNKKKSELEEAFNLVLNHNQKTVNLEVGGYSITMGKEDLLNEIRTNMENHAYAMDQAMAKVKQLGDIEL